MRKSLILTPVLALLFLGLTACGTSAATSSTTDASTAATPTAVTSNTTPVTTAASTQTAEKTKAADQVMTIVPGLRLGPDGKMHDSFSPADLTLMQGVTTKVTVLNYDDGAHDFVSKDLKLKVQIPGSQKKGDPSVTTFTVTPDKTGDFQWYCDISCDGEANGWAMHNNGYMAGTVHVQ